ncbi:MAG: hypothetical protein Q9221_000468 [Calogaya cf. arnoldii]
MTTADVRDMLGLPTDGQPKIRPAKKNKQEAKGRRPGGLEREIQSLHGDRPAPPLSINELPKYKEKPKRTQRYRHWDITPFGNSARTDGLVLRHWNWRDDVNTNVFPTTPADSNAASEEQDDRVPKPTSDYKYAKYNVRIDRPVYSDEQYDAQLRNEDWTKDETDYLMDIAHEFDLRWVIIADRYNYQPLQNMQQGNAMAITTPPKHRTMEDMKARYYQVAAIAMALVNPLTSMSESEFAIHEKMTKFDPALETKRKQFAESLLSRSREEVQEEEILLTELKRIVKNEEKFMQDRQELYARLETAPSTTSTTVNRSSEGLTQLLKTLCEAEKNKRKRILGGDTPANGVSGQNAGGPSDRGQRHSLGGTDKRSSLSGSQGQRQLSMRDQLRYGVTHHERLSAGVQFRHEKILKLSQAKSNAQSTKINAALTELGIPARIYMPTAKTTNEYERLIQSINILLDVRKISEKVDTEIKVIQAQREPKEFPDGDQKPELPSDSWTRGEGVEDASPQSQNAEEAEEAGDAEDAEDAGDAEEAEAEVEADGDGNHGREDDNDDNIDAEAEAEAEVDIEDDVDAVDRNEEDSEEGFDEENEKGMVSNDDRGDDGDEGEELDSLDHVEEQDDDSAEESADAMVSSGARSTTGRKRSASLISTTSNKSSKRQKR